ncbi:MAG: DUF732 domain-containing protein [Timaviella obliquedivisa GSE-PSE-MK23-08B]|jgi:hypothetical protein|nr:DUF732 domain-containing protein [Timaviella obliquedivisa GSE-PSE-MK23-08B]
MFTIFLKIPRSVAFLSIALVSTVVFPPLLAAQEFAQDRLGVCPLYNLSGYSTIDIDGNLVNLTAYCQGLGNASEVRRDRFWESFIEAADDEAIAYANTYGRTKVTAYGNTICLFLRHGGTLEELRQVQADQLFPPTFDVAVTTAAIQTYCPTDAAKIGE